MSLPEYSVRNTRIKRAEAVFKDLPENPEPAEGDKYMCRQCEQVFGQNDEITMVFICRACMISIEAERLFTGHWLQ